MHVKIARDGLVSISHRVQGAIEDRGYAQIGLKAEGSVLSASVVDKTMAAYASSSCQVDQSGVVFVPARIFIDITRELPVGIISLIKEGSVLVVKGGASNQFIMKLPIIEEAFWREQPTFLHASSCSISSAKLSYMIEQVSFCVNIECPRNYGTVAYLHKDSSGVLRLVGSDGFRLSYCDINSEMPENFLEKGICISKRSLLELHKMCQEGSQEILIAISSDQSMVSATINNYDLFFLVSVIKYPNYKTVIPSGHQKKVLVDKVVMQSVTKRILLASDKMRSLQLSFSNEGLTLSAKDVGTTEGKELVNLNLQGNFDQKIAVNGRYLNEIFSICSGQEIEMQFEDEETPILIHSISEPKDCKSQHVLVPLQER
ncbi:MAG: DNA polymerase III subunit beta [Oligoflexales bacterium]|nr:DNA polymerase III subunit beta [Oligoflexales bacterium]